MLASGFIGTPQTADTLDTSSTKAIIASDMIPNVSVASTTATSQEKTGKANLKNKIYKFNEVVQKFASDKPLMVEIANCESQFRQFNRDGSVLRGIVNNQDVGLFQINEHYHLERAKRLGYDIYSPEGNMAYARVLFNEEGPEPWTSSSPCWSRTTAYQNYVTANGDMLAVK